MPNEMRNVTPRKLPGGLGWGVLAGPGGAAGETVQVTTRRGKTWTATLVEEITAGVWSTDQTEAASGATRDRLERRAERREEWADSRERKGEAAWDASSRAVEGIPMGQPILVGHHSERGHRKALDTSERKAFEAIEHHRMADQHQQAAAGIRRQLDQSIYDDDPDAIEALTERIAILEEQRERIKELNRRIRKGEPLDSLGLTEKEVRDLEFAAANHGRRTFPPYVLQNLGGNIKRQKDRLARLKKLRGMG